MMNFLKIAIVMIFFGAAVVIVFLYRELTKSKTEVNTLKEELSEAIVTINNKDKQLKFLENKVKGLEEENYRLRTKINSAKLSDKKS